MSAPFDPWRTAAVYMDVLRASCGTRETIQGRQSRRLARLLESAARRSPLYRERLPGGGGLPPPVTKHELMARFDDWVGDPRLRLPALRDFLADPHCIGSDFAGEFTVWESSGSSGELGVFVQDAFSMAVYDALEAARRAPLAPMRRWMDPLYANERIAFVGAIDGHFASVVSVQRLRRLNATLARSMRCVSFLQPTASLVDELNRLHPTIVVTYPTAAVLLAEEADAGRLHLSLREVWTGGEALTPAMRQGVERALGAPVSNSYGASEFLALASQCREGAMHLNSDWALLEPVDEHHRPVPVGTTGATTLLTNLANHVQPIIRYDLGDRVRLHGAACRCGSPLPVIEVEGRCDDSLLLRDARGQDVRLLPLALTTVLEEDAHVYDFQIVQQGRDGLDVTVADELGAEAADQARAALQAFLVAQGLAQVRVQARNGAARHRGRSGKVPRVVVASP